MPGIQALTLVDVPVTRLFLGGLCARSYPRNAIFPLPSWMMSGNSLQRRLDLVGELPWGMGRDQVGAMVAFTFSMENMSLAEMEGKGPRHQAV